MVHVEVDCQMQACHKAEVRHVVAANLAYHKAKEVPTVAGNLCQVEDPWPSAEEAQASSSCVVDAPAVQNVVASCQSVGKACALNANSLGDLGDLGGLVGQGQEHRDRTDRTDRLAEAEGSSEEAQVHAPSVSPAPCLWLQRQPGQLSLQQSRQQ